MKIIYCTTVLPSRRRTGGEIASQAFIDAMRAAGHAVIVLGYRRPDDKSPLGSDETVVDERPIESNDAGLNVAKWLALSLVQGHPYSVQKYVSDSYRRKLTELLQSSPDATVVIDHAQMAFLADRLPARQRLVFVAHNVESELYAGKADKGASFVRHALNARESRLIRSMEFRMAERADQTWVLTRHDHDVFRREAPAAAVGSFALPGMPSLNAESTGEADDQWDIGLIGTWSWEANRVGLEWFLSEVLPMLPAGMRIGLAGKGTESLDAPGVAKLGFVPDALAFMRSCRVVCVPSVSGGGVQIKTIDAIASGRPIVATPTALRGIESPPASVTSCETADVFAQTTAALTRHFIQTSQEAISWTTQRTTAFEQAVAQHIRQLEHEPA